MPNRGGAILPIINNQNNTKMNTVSKTYSSKSNAKRALKSKTHYFHEDETKGSISFGNLWIEGATLYASSDYWSETTLSDFLNNKNNVKL